MQLLNVVSAKATWLFDLADLNPRGKDVMSDLIEWLKENYGFEKVPASATDFDAESKGLTFKQGSFQAAEEIFVSVELSIFNDGLVANSGSNTKDTEAFLEDVLTSAATDFKLAYRPSMIRTKIYMSEVVVKLDQPLGKLNSKLASFANRITEAVGRESATQFEPGGISFWADTMMSALKPVPFSIERKVNAPFSEGRFYSKAPLQTDDHLRLLNEFEQILTSETSATPRTH